MKFLIDIDEEDYFAIKSECLFFIGHDKYDEAVTKSFKSAVRVPDNVCGFIVDGDPLPDDE